MINFFALKTEDEGDEVSSERRDPEQRDWRDIRTQMSGNGKQQRGAAGGEGDPKRLLDPAWRIAVGRCFARGCGGARIPT